MSSGKAEMSAGQHDGDDDFGRRKHELVLEQLRLCREGVERVDTADRDSWRKIIGELFEGGFQSDELEEELAASSNTIYKWRNGLAAPREMTRRLLQRAIIEMVDERINHAALTH